MMGTYFTEERVRAVLAQGLYGGLSAPWEAENSNSAQVASRIEFWTMALALDDGALLAGMGLTARANAEIKKYTYFRDNNEFEHPVYR